MAPKQRMRIANDKASKNVTMRGNVPKSSVSMQIPDCFVIVYTVRSYDTVKLWSVIVVIVLKILIHKPGFHNYYFVFC